MDNRSKIIRLFVDASLFISMFLFPWWFVVFLALVCIFIFKSFYEFLVIGYLLGVFSGGGGDTVLYFSSAAAILMVVLVTIKQQLIFSNR